MADIYEDYIREFVDGVKNLSLGIETLGAIYDSNPNFPSPDKIQSIWDEIARASEALLGQAKFVEIYLASIDTLFKQN